MNLPLCLFLAHYPRFPISLVLMATLNQVSRIIFLSVYVLVVLLDAGL